MVADQRDFVVTGREVNVEPYNGSVAIVVSPPPLPHAQQPAMRPAGGSWRWN